MSRYYSGDIEGKFWFATQSSKDGEFFGAEKQSYNYIPYTVHNEDKAEVSKGIKKCKKELGEWFDFFNEFFNEYNTYSGSKIQKYIYEKKYNLYFKDYTEKIKWYARLELGLKMQEFFKENPNNDLFFDAEI